MLRYKSSPRRNLHYPVELVLAGRRCLIAGGGVVAARKARALLRCGARLLVVSPRCVAELERLAATGRITVRRRQFRADDLRGTALAIAATDDRAVNEAVSRHARRRGVWVNVVDAPALCTVIAPAVMRRGPLTIAVSTSGASPATAKRIRRELERRYGPEYAPYLRLLRAARAVIRSQVADRRRREALVARVLRSNLLTLIRRGQGAQARRRVMALVRRDVERAGSHGDL